MNESLLSLINSENYQIYNRDIAEKLDSVHAAIMLSELINRYQYHKKRDELVICKKREEWFFYTFETCKERTRFSRKNQESSIKTLEKYDLIEKSRIGIPAKRHFKLKIDNILKLVSSEHVDERCPKVAGNIAQKGQTVTIKKSNLIKNPIKNSIKESSICADDVNAHAVAYAENDDCLQKKEKDIAGDRKIKHLENVYLTDKEHKKLVKIYGESAVIAMIEKLNSYDRVSRYKSHYLVIRKWLAKDKAVLEQKKIDELKEQISKMARADDNARECFEWLESHKTVLEARECAKTYEDMIKYCYDAKNDVEALRKAYEMFLIAYDKRNREKRPINNKFAYFGRVIESAYRELYKIEYVSDEQQKSSSRENRFRELALDLYHVMSCINDASVRYDAEKIYRAATSHDLQPILYDNYYITAKNDDFEGELNALIQIYSEMLAKQSAD